MHFAMLSPLDKLMHPDMDRSGGGSQSARASERRSRSISKIRITKLIVTMLGSLLIAACASERQSDDSSLEITLLFTNDFESAYEPVEAYWRDDIERIGGIAYLASLIEDVRAREPHVFLFDAGDIFTGTLAKRTQGELSFELMLSMAYDAMTIGNHEFEYGWEVLARQKDRVPFPVLGANLSYQDNGAPFAQRYAIIERHGVRLGVIGVMGLDAATALIPTNIAGVAVRDPVEVVRELVTKLRADVDVIVVLTHQGQTAPMQTNDEADPSVYRGNAENVALAAAVPGIDVIFAGHTDAGTRAAIREPTNGTLIMQTFGQGQHLGELRLSVNPGQGDVELLGSSLLTVNADRLDPHPEIVKKLRHYESQHTEIFEAVVRLDRVASRQYYVESTLGNLTADALRVLTGAEIGLMPSGALRRDLPAGTVRSVDLHDMFPFTDRMATLELRGDVLQAVLEQGVSLERGLLQVSGVGLQVDFEKPVGRRLQSIRVGRQALDPSRVYRVATVEILAQGGDEYQAFLDAESLRYSDERFIDAFEGYLREQKSVRVPAVGRISQ